MIITFAHFAIKIENSDKYPLPTPEDKFAYNRMQKEQKLSKFVAHVLTLKKKNEKRRFCRFIYLIYFQD